MAFSEEEKQILLKDIRDIKYLLIGNGDPEKGLVFKVNRNTEFVGTVKKIIWLFAGAAIGIPASLYIANAIQHL